MSGHTSYIREMSEAAAREFADASFALASRYLA
jgi:hypothetical protein